MALPLMLGVCLVAGVVCFLTDRATKAANRFTHDSDNVNHRPPAPATSSNNFNRRPSAPATSSDTLNRRSPAPATSSNNLIPRPPALATSSNNLNPQPPPATSSNNIIPRPPAPATSSNNLIPRPPAPATSSNNLNPQPPPATSSNNLIPRPPAPATSSNNLIMHLCEIAAEPAKYEVDPLDHSTGALGGVEVHWQTNIVEEVKINELSTGIAEGLENNEVVEGSLGDGLGAVTSAVDPELDDNIDVVTPLIDEADVLKLEEESVNLSGSMMGSGEGWWVAVKKWVEEPFRWVKRKLKRRAEWVIDKADVFKLKEEAVNSSGGVIGSAEGWWVTVKKWAEERFRWVKGKLDPDEGVVMRRTLTRLVWVVVDSLVESKYAIGHNRVLLKMYRILINELRYR